MLLGRNIGLICSNTRDAHDRLKALVKSATGPRNRYNPILLLVSWNGETLQEITKTLELESFFESFDSVGVLSLNTEDPDAQMEAVMGDLVQQSKPKSRLYVDLKGELRLSHRIHELMKDVMERMLEGWKRWLTVVSMISPQKGASDQAVVLDVVKIGIRILNGLDPMVREAIGRIEWDASTTYKTVKLPLASNILM